MARWFCRRCGRAFTYRPRVVSHFDHVTGRREDCDIGSKSCRRCRWKPGLQGAAVGVVISLVYGLVMWWVTR